MSDDEPNVMGAGGYPPPMPTKEEAEAVWREMFAQRFVELGVFDLQSARDFAAAGDVDLSVSPQDAADDELSYWADDGD